MLLPVEAGTREGDLAEIADGMRLVGRDHVVVGLLVLQHPPHRLDVVRRISPVAPGIEVAHRQARLKPELDASHAVGNLPGDELETAPRRLVVEEDAAHREEAIRFAIIHGDEVSVGLRHAVRRARVERRALVLRHFAHLAEHLGRRRLVEARRGRGVPHRLEHLRHAQRGELARQRRLVPAGRHERLRGEVVDLVRLQIAEEPRERKLVEQVSLVEQDLSLQVRDALELLLRGPAHHSVDFVALRKQQLGEVAAVLSGDPGDQRALGHGESPRLLG